MIASVHDPALDELYAEILPEVKKPSPRNCVPPSGAIPACTMV
jgi:hypothetical protein